MVTREDIQATCDDIVREFSPLQVILFGSYAYGTPTENSDEDVIDFLYPGKYATAEDASQAIQTCTEVRQAIRSELKLPQNQSERLT